MNPAKEAAKPIIIEDIANKIPPTKIVFTIFEPERILIPYKEMGKKRIECSEENINISFLSQPILLRNMKKKEW